MAMLNNQRVHGMHWTLLNYNSLADHFPILNPQPSQGQVIQVISGRIVDSNPNHHVSCRRKVRLRSFLPSFCCGSIGPNPIYIYICIYIYVYVYIYIYIYPHFCWLTCLFPTSNLHLGAKSQNCWKFQTWTPHFSWLLQGAVPLVNIMCIYNIYIYIWIYIIYILYIIQRPDPNLWGLSPCLYRFFTSPAQIPLKYPLNIH